MDLMVGVQLTWWDAIDLVGVQLTKGERSSVLV